MNFSDLIDPILHNQVVTGLSFTALLGAGAYQLRNIPHMVQRTVLRFFTVELTTISTDISFDWVDRWLAQQPYATRAKSLTLRSHSSPDGISAYVGENQPQSDWSLSPGPGLHVFWWRKRPVFLERRYLSKEGDDSSSRNKPVESLRFRTIGRSQEIIRRLIQEVRDYSLSDDKVTIKVWADYWHKVPAKAKRPLESIILRDGQIDRIIDDLQWFHCARDWYVQRGIPYRRGYLFSGPPGTGKTSMVLALAGMFNRPICVLNLSAVDNDTALLSAFSEAPPDAILLVEDIDCAFSAQTRAADTVDPARGVTKAGLLNAIDGITTPDGRIFIMTSNYPERLDPALVRPGRADVREEFGYLSPTEQQKMAERFYRAAFRPVLFPVSPAQLQSIFMLHPHDPEAAHRTLAERGDNV